VLYIIVRLGLMLFSKAPLVHQLIVSIHHVGRQAISSLRLAHFTAMWLAAIRYWVEQSLSTVLRTRPQVLRGRPSTTFIALMR